LFEELVEQIGSRGNRDPRGHDADRDEGDGSPDTFRALAAPLNHHDRNGNVRPQLTIVTEPIVITGIGVVSAFGDSPDAFRDALLEGRTGISLDAGFEGCRSRLSARIAGFQPSKWIPPMKLRRMDDTGPLALVVAQQAAAQAKYPVGGDANDRAGVVLGTYSAGGRSTTEYLTALFSGGPTNAPALLFNSTVGNAAAGLTGLELKLRGPNATISQKEASGLAAIVTAVDLLREGRLDAAVAGGIDSIYDLFYRVHDRFRVMSDAREADDSVAPFSACRRGFVLGEGGFGMWLERGEAWRTRGAAAIAEVLGVAASSAAVPLNAWPDRAEPLVRTMRMALDDAGISAEEIDVVYASANATRVLDRIEAEALSAVFAGCRPVVTSVKGAIGESGAASAASGVTAVLCGGVGAIPPITGLGSPDAGSAALDLAIARRNGPARTALVNAFASGGALFSAVLRVDPASGGS
jgi:3-oxoacyl-(acyl-carrier-protein) synthase